MFVEVLNGGIHSVVDLIGHVEVLNRGRHGVVEDGAIRLITFCTDVSFCYFLFFFFVRFLTVVFLVVLGDILKMSNPNTNK